MTKDAAHSRGDRRESPPRARRGGTRVARAGLLVAAMSCGFSSGCLCAGSRGVLVGAGPDTRFVSERATLMIDAPDGLRAVDIDGSRSRLVFSGHLRIHDVDPQFRTFVLSDSETNLLIGDATTGTVRPVPGLAKRLSDAALSPDGTRIAATRHSDFSLPQAQWRDDDAVFLVDVATLATEAIPASSSDWPTKIQWSADGKALWLSMAFGKPSQWLTLSDRARKGGLSSSPEGLRADPRARPTACEQKVEADRWEPRISIVDSAAAAPRVLVQLQGRERGFHDYQPDFSKPALTPACRYVVFEHASKVWIADVSGKPFGPLSDGDWLFFFPGAPPKP